MSLQDRKFALKFSQEHLDVSRTQRRKKWMHVCLVRVMGHRNEITFQLGIRVTNYSLKNSFHYLKGKYGITYIPTDKSKTTRRSAARLCERHERAGKTPRCSLGHEPPDGSLSEAASSAARQCVVAVTLGETKVTRCAEMFEVVSQLSSPSPLNSSHHGERGCTRNVRHVSHVANRGGVTWVTMVGGQRFNFAVSEVPLQAFKRQLYRRVICMIHDTSHYDTTPRTVGTAQEVLMCESLSSELKEMFKMPSLSTNTCINPPLNGHRQVDVAALLECAPACEAYQRPWSVGSQATGTPRVERCRTESVEVSTQIVSVTETRQECHPPPLPFPSPPYKQFVSPTLFPLPLYFNAPCRSAGNKANFCVTRHKFAKFTSPHWWHLRVELIASGWRLNVLTRAFRRHTFKACGQWSKQTLKYLATLMAFSVNTIAWHDNSVRHMVQAWLAISRPCDGCKMVLRWDIAVISIWTMLGPFVFTTPGPVINRVSGAISRPAMVPGACQLLANCLPAWHLNDIHGDSSPFLLQTIPRAEQWILAAPDEPSPGIQFVPKMFYRFEVGALDGPA
ncbi:hypothetical protein PR048_019707 [Dryococelus australis]|uniref:Uncharacterized protein n=1 Tax=Dryococelus australis TaxID=614101 RepID=A0ABQ9H491_9NEOP|nr:hypothetical protein PR048_019707 [Dryococelus australis]